MTCSSVKRFFTSNLLGGRELDSKLGCYSKSGGRRDGRRFRLLPVLVHFTHECLDIVVDQCLRAEDVAAIVARLLAQRGKPEAIKVDNGSEFAGM
ncbi:hypothetical protein CFBP1159_22100 [Xanthomonas arboricola pv. corylina]|uniref:Integrase catalytic domain-containing protein n=2 Tax=Xanthomonas arboricola TaxID=56448 RepID=A0A8D6V3J2_9XANT|nr:hypothetical protein CFBP1159_22100 [Xanthomonas arboricola pv. corylina]CAE6773000.1 hypothetical protein CFBP1159_22100 [Xanthomonas arboricola pv. corylina]